MSSQVADAGFELTTSYHNIRGASSNHCTTTTGRGFDRNVVNKMKWNESGFRALLCTYRLNWAGRSSRKWWDEWDLQTQDSEFKPCRFEAGHASSRSQRLSIILSFTSEWGRNIFCFFQTAETVKRTRTLAWKAAVLTTILEPPPLVVSYLQIFLIDVTFYI